MGNATGNLLRPLRSSPEAEDLPSPTVGEETDLPEDLPPLEEVPAQETCAICFEEGNVLHLGCGHTYCLECLEGQLAARWPGQRVTFQYLQCGLCREPLVHDLIQASVYKNLELRNRVVAIAVQKFREDSPDEVAHMCDLQVERRAEAEMAVYMCDDCCEPYCAGRVDCAMATADEEAMAQHRCHECEWAMMAKRGDRRCMRHGHRFAMFKCDSCCAVAVWNCYSNHYCERCHNQASLAKHYPCPGPGLCPLGMPHPRNCEAVHFDHNVTSFVIACSACLGFEEAQDVDFSMENQFGYPDRDWLSFNSGAEVLASIGEEEVRGRLGDQSIDISSAVECANQLLLLEKPKQLADQEAAWAREEAAEAARVAAEAARVAEEVAIARESYAVVEGAIAAEEAFKEAAVMPPIEDPTVLKAKREEIREADTRRDGARRVHLVMKHARISRGIRCRQRGGRHKVSSIVRPESDDSSYCGIDDFGNELLSALGYE